MFRILLLSLAEETRLIDITYTLYTNRRCRESWHAEQSKSNSTILFKITVSKPIIGQRVYYDHTKPKSL